MGLHIYEKMQNAKVEFLSMKIKKSGWNDYSKFYYFELSDIMPPIIDIFTRYKIYSLVSFGKELARLTLFNIEELSQRIVITSPMSSADLTACKEVQNLGAVQTYLRRYLYMAALDIVDLDVLDATTGKAAPKKGTAGKTAKSNIKAEKGQIEREINSKFANSFCNFCRKKHGEIGDLVVMVDGKWGAKACFLKQSGIKEEVDEGIKTAEKFEQGNMPLPEAQDIHGQPPPPSDGDAPF